MSKPLVPGRFAAWGRTFSQHSDFFWKKPLLGQLRCLGQILNPTFGLFFEQATCPRQLRCLGQKCCFLRNPILFWNKPLVPGSFAAWGRTIFLKKRTFSISGTPVRRTKRRKSQKMDFQEFWDSCAQNKTSEIPKMDFQDISDSNAQNKASEISKTALS